MAKTEGTPGRSRRLAQVVTLLLFLALLIGASVLAQRRVSGSTAAITAESEAGAARPLTPESTSSRTPTSTHSTGTPPAEPESSAATATKGTERSKASNPVTPERANAKPRRFLPSTKSGVLPVDDNPEPANPEPTKPRVFLPSTKAFGGQGLRDTPAPQQQTAP
ncbi:MAG: hypothetical protein R3B13_13730 [Polyangiaceae bacterium]